MSNLSQSRHKTSVIKSTNTQNPFFWNGSPEPQALSQETLAAMLQKFTEPVILIENDGNVFLSNQLAISTIDSKWKVLGFSQPFPIESFGDPAFLKTYNLKYPLYGGSMANAIASEEFVISLGNAGFMGSCGAGACVPTRVEKAINTIIAALRDKQFAFNLINIPF